MHRPSPIDPRDARALAEWVTHSRELMVALHAIAIDGASKGRIYARKEVRKRICRLTKRMSAQLDCLAPCSAPAVSQVPAALVPTD